MDREILPPPSIYPQFDTLPPPHMDSFRRPWTYRTKNIHLHNKYFP